MLAFLFACIPGPSPEPSPAPPAACVTKNVCPDYSSAWSEACPEGQRCLTFVNASATDVVALSYQVGCNSDGTAGAPQCNCAAGPALAPGASAFFLVTNGNYAPGCPAEWGPPCLTEGLAVIGNRSVGSCASGTRFEFTAGNLADPYGKFDAWDIDVEKGFYSVPVEVVPDLECAEDHANHDCRPEVCFSGDCPDAFDTPTSGSCPDGRSPAVGCQDTFNLSRGVTVTWFPAASQDVSCRDAEPC